MTTTPLPLPEAPLATRVVRVRGRVQGVGYRWSCVQHARACGITGWVRNRMDESVEALLQGPPAMLDAMCEWMADEVPAALVESMEVSDVAPPFVRYEGFEQRPTA